MKKLFILSLIFIATSITYAQDLILTNTGDSINCKVTGIKDGNIYFDFEKNDETKRTMLPLSKVKENQTNYYSKKTNEPLVVITTSKDLVVTDTGDSILCKITEIDSVNIYFTFEKNDVTRNTMLPLSKVKDYQKSYLTTTKKVEPLVNNNYSRLRLAVNGGYSYRVAKISDDTPSDFESYMKDLKSGYHYGADLTYFYKESYGIGIMYNAFRSSNSMDIYGYDFYNNLQYGKMSDDITISFIAPSFTIRTLDKRNAFLMDFAIGYIRYVDEAVLFDPYKITGNTVGFSFGLGYDIGLSESFGLGFKVGIIAGSLTEYNINNGTNTQKVELDEESYENLTRIDLSVGLRLYK